VSFGKEQLITINFMIEGGMLRHSSMSWDVLKMELYIGTQTIILGENVPD
jgi:hypothetical protein